MHPIIRRSSQIRTVKVRGGLLALPHKGLRNRPIVDKPTLEEGGRVRAEDHAFVSRMTNVLFLVKKGCPYLKGPQPGKVHRAREVTAQA